MDAVKGLLNSRKGQAALVAILTMVGVAWLGWEQDAAREQAAKIAVAITGLGSVLMVAIAAEDGAKKLFGQSEHPPKTGWQALFGRKFLIAVGVIVVQVGVAFWHWDPDTAAQTIESLSEHIMVIMSLFIGTTAGEDVCGKLFEKGNK